MSFYDFFWNARQDAKISSTRSSVSDAKEDLNRSRLEIDVLRNQIDRLAIAAAAMAEILQERVGLTAQELTDKITEIDLRDGVLDGRITKTPKACKSCGRTVSNTRQACLYCGEGA